MQLTCNDVSRRARTLVAAVAAGLLMASAAASIASAQDHVGPDYVSSKNLDLVARIKTPGDGVGARLLGNYLYVTSTKSLDIYDIKTDPEHPRQVGLEALDVEFENEEVPTNGKLLGISGEIGCRDLAIMLQGGGNCLSLYDVSDPANVKYLTSVGGAGDHTSTCLFDCKWFWGSYGSLTDAHDPAHATLVGRWDQGVDGDFRSNCHHLREIQPGLVLGSCQPIVLLSARAEDGGTVKNPVVLATGTNQDQRFIHSSRWPRAGADRFMLSGGETNASPTCDDTVGAFMVWDASDVIKPGGGFKKGSEFHLLDEFRPVNGTYADGHSPYNILGCSVHWFQEEPSFHNGGAVALAMYENGTHILQITPQGKIVDKDFFLPLGGSTSAPHWNPNGKVIYSIDYARGVDVLRYTGPTYVPAGGNEAKLSDAPCAAAAGFRSVRARAAGSGVKFTPSLREKRSYSLEVFQQSSGRKILSDKLVAKFSGKKSAFTWDGRRRAGALSDGYYYARFTMKLADGTKDVRLVTLRRAHGRFATAPDFAQRVSCGEFTTYRLSGAVFGGSANAPLAFSYKLAHDVEAVQVTVLRGKKVVKKFSGGGSSARAFSFSVPARSVPRGAVVTVRATIVNGPGRGQTLMAKRL
ncbi:MAG: hypothetical protein QOI98_2995 [Solirubrobacteraceae bacterium]|nr:hypothetical protein [Solirubrobacteraceae bacterium]